MGDFPILVGNLYMSQSLTQISFIERQQSDHCAGAPFIPKKLVNGLLLQIVLFLTHFIFDNFEIFYR